MTKKLFLVHNESKAEQMRPHFSDEWMIKSFHSALVGHKFDLILVADQPEERNRDPDRWRKKMSQISTHLLPGAELIEVY